MWTTSTSGKLYKDNPEEEHKKLIKVHTISKELCYMDLSVEYKGHLPKKATEGSCAYDLYYCGDVVDIKPGEIAVLGVGIILEIPNDIAGLILSRSGLSAEGIFVINAPGLIDSDYRGEVKVILCNISKKTKTIKNGDRIAQILFFKKENVELLEVSKDEITKTERGDRGIGSTGK